MMLIQYKERLKTGETDAPIKKKSQELKIQIGYHLCFCSREPHAFLVG